MPFQKAGKQLSAIFRYEYQVSRRAGLLDAFAQSQERIVAVWINTGQVMCVVVTALWHYAERSTCLSSVFYNLKSVIRMAKVEI